jgi:hypothetical protein
MLADNRVQQQLELMKVVITTIVLKWSYKKVMKNKNTEIYQQLHLTCRMKQVNVEQSQKAMRFLTQRLL